MARKLQKKIIKKRGNCKNFSGNLMVMSEGEINECPSELRIEMQSF